MQYRVAACGLIKLPLLYDNFFCIFTDLPPGTLHHIIIKMFIGSPESHGVFINRKSMAVLHCKAVILH